MQNNNEVGPGGHPACASCKHQRKRCGEDCLLAPYFPANRSREFQAIHKVFGVSNVTKFVKNVKEEQRNMLVDSLIWEAMSREKDPVLGPLGDYRRLQDQLAYCMRQNQSLHNALSQLQHQHPRGVLWNTSNLMGSNVISNNSVASNGFGGGRGGRYYNSSRDMINYDDIINRDAAIGEVKPFSYPTNYMQSQEKVKENSVTSVLVPRQQHQNNSFPGFNHQHQHQHHNPAASASTSPPVQSFRTYQYSMEAKPDDNAWIN